MSESHSSEQVLAESSRQMALQCWRNVCQSLLYRTWYYKCNRSWLVWPFYPESYCTKCECCWLKLIAVSAVKTRNLIVDVVLCRVYGRRQGQW